MSYWRTVPNENNRARSAGGDIVRMQSNFDHLYPLASAISGDGSGDAARLRGLMVGNTANGRRFFAYSSASTRLTLARNTGSEASPSWQPVFSFSQNDGDGATFHYAVSGVDPTVSAHLATKYYVDQQVAGVSASLSGLTDTDVASQSSGDFLQFDGSDWVPGTATSTLAGCTDTSFAGLVSGEVLTYNGAQWVNEPGAPGTLSGLTDTTVAGPVSGEVLTWNGSAWVNQVGGGGASTLSGLTDTTIAGPTSGQVLEWNGTDWVNQDFSAGTLSGMTDTTITAPTSGQVLEWNGTLWQNVNFTAGTLSGMTDTVITSPTSGQVLEWNGSQWLNADFVAGTLSGLTDTAISSPTSGQVLTWNGTAWEADDAGAGSATLSGLTDTTITAPVANASLRWSGSAWVDDLPAASGVGLVEVFDFAVDTAASGDSFTISLHAVYAHDVKTVYAKTSSGACELTFKIGGTPITGLSAITVNTSKSTDTASAANSISEGDEFTVELVSGATVSGLTCTVKTERT